MRTIHDIRRHNLRIIIDEEFPSARQLALKMGTSPNNLSRVFSENPESRRNVGDDMARSVERAAGKPVGWMDVDHEARYMASSISEPTGPYETELYEMFLKMTEEEFLTFCRAFMPRLSEDKRTALAKIALTDPPQGD